MTLLELRDLTSADLPFRKDALDDESFRIWRLLEKYLIFYHEEWAHQRKMERAMKKLLHEKRLYYSGKASPDVYKDKPFDLNVKLKSELEAFIECDEHVMNAYDALDKQEILVKILKETVEGIKFRGLQVKNALDWEKLHGATPTIPEYC